MPDRFKARCLPTLIGSLPLKDHEEASNLVFEYVPELPVWVQLPAMKQEGMLLQFLPGMPGVVFQNEKVFVDTSAEDFETELLAFYEEYMEVLESKKRFSESRFRLETGTAKGFFTLLNRLRQNKRKPVAIKGQITGPFTFSTSLTNQESRAIFYDEQLRDAAVKMLALKAQWQIQELKPLGCPIIIFFDEPALAGFGSSEFISISKEDIAACLNEVVTAVHAEGGLAGIHVCANTDWSLLLESDLDIINFDAYSYFDRFILYQRQIRQFIDSGRILAWGIVPTLNPEDIERETIDTLMGVWQEKVAQIEALGVDHKTILEQSLITPSCGVGSLSIASATKVLALTKELSARIRSELKPEPV